MARLSAFLREAARTPFAWGQSDCTLTGANWVRLVEGWDPADGWRGAYADESGAEALLLASGGLASLVGARLERPLIDDPVAGDVGVVTVRGPHGRAEVVAICTGTRWAAKSPRGIWIGRADCLAAWRVG